MVKVGLIGAGMVGSAYVESIMRTPDVHLVAVADPNGGKAQKLAETSGAQVFTEIHDLLESDAVEAVVIASPTPFHFFQAREALQRGKHVLLEIPMVRSWQEAEELQAQSRQSSAVLTVAHVQRFFNENEMIRQQVNQGAAGKPAMIRMSRRTPHPKRWYSNFEASGGVILDSMIHELDFLQWVFGPAKRVYCQAMRGRKDTENLDYALASIRMESGAIAHIESSWCHYGQFNIDIEVAGDKGLIQYDNNESTPLHFSEIDPNQGSRNYYFESPVYEPSYHKMFRQFIQAVQGRGENPVPVEEGMSAVKLALAAIRSAEMGQPVELENFKG
ncbi:MAG: Gfo/Idh/MocA family protein [bacterium]|jgi:UDP-N-acetylglucosamine 3-dehydrogenase